MRLKGRTWRYFVSSTKSDYISKKWHRQHEGAERYDDSSCNCWSNQDEPTITEGKRKRLTASVILPLHLQELWLLGALQTVVLCECQLYRPPKLAQIGTFSVLYHLARKQKVRSTSQQMPSWKGTFKASHRCQLCSCSWWRMKFSAYTDTSLQDYIPSKKYILSV